MTQDERWLIKYEEAMEFMESNEECRDLVLFLISAYGARINE